MSQGQAVTVTPADRWRLLQLFSLYRIGLALLLSTLFFSGLGPKLLGETDPYLYASTAILYLIAAAGSLLFALIRRPDNQLLQLYLQLTIDLAAVTTLMHASGGVRSGLGMLLIASIAAGGLLLTGRMAILIAAVGALAILFEQLYADLNQLFFTTYYTQSGILGATFMVTALVAHQLAQRVQSSEELAERRGIDLANMEQLNDYIIRHLQAGILVVDCKRQIRLCNNAAARLLQSSPDEQESPMPTGSSLAETLPQLEQLLSNWPPDSSELTTPLRIRGGEIELIANITRIVNRQAGHLIVLEESRLLEEQAQQIRLASLGRLTASIAHEVRNPLGAISHAAQLLAESPLAGDDQRLLKIISSQSKRVNAIISSVLQISRKEPAHPQSIDLHDWCSRFVREFSHGESIEPERIELSIEQGVTIHVDPIQLHQILWNLCRNATIYGTREGEDRWLAITGGANGDRGGPWLEVRDHGAGVDETLRSRIFEPFFTSGNSGSGLGLYIARELAVANQARLSYHYTEGEGSRFRLSFVEHDRLRLLR